MSETIDDNRLAELWNKSMEPCGWLSFDAEFDFDNEKKGIRQFAADLVDDKCYELQKECRRLKQHEAAAREWLAKTEWVQDASTSRFAFPVLGVHRADVMRKHVENLEAELAALNAQQQPKPEPIESDDERAGREMYEEWRSGVGATFDWGDLSLSKRHFWIAFAKRRPKVVPLAPKLREPGQVLCDAMTGYLCPWNGRSDKSRLNAIARELGIKEQP